MNLTIGQMIKAIVFGFTAGILATLFLLFIGDTTNEVIYGASIGMTRVFVTIICSVACIVAEMVCDTSAREVGVDVIISIIVSFLFVGDGFFNPTDNMKSIEVMIGPILVSVVIAAFLSFPIQHYGAKIFDIKPFSKFGGK